MADLMDNTRLRRIPRFGNKVVGQKGDITKDKIIFLAVVGGLI